MRMSRGAITLVLLLLAATRALAQTTPSTLTVPNVTPKVENGVVLAKTLDENSLEIAFGTFSIRFSGEGEALETRIRAVAAKMESLGIDSAETRLLDPAAKDRVVVLWVRSNQGPVTGRGNRAILIVGGSHANGTLIAAESTVYAVGQSSGTGVGGNATAATEGFTPASYAYGGNGLTAGGKAEAKSNGDLAFAKGGSGGSHVTPGMGGSADAAGRGADATARANVEARGGDAGIGGGQGGSATAKGLKSKAVAGNANAQDDPVAGAPAEAESMGHDVITEAIGGRGGSLIKREALAGTTRGTQAGKGGKATATAPRGYALAKGGAGGNATGVGLKSGDGGDAVAKGKNPDPKGGPPGDVFAGATKGVKGSEDPKQTGRR